MYPKSFIQFHQEVRKILGVQVRCLDTGHRETDLVPEVAPPEVAPPEEGHLKMTST